MSGQENAAASIAEAQDEESNQLYIVDDVKNDKRQPPSDAGPSGGKKPTTSESSPTPAKNRKRKSDKTSAGNSPAKKQKGPMTSEMEAEMAQAERKDIDMFLEDTAERHNLSVANVKSILRRIATNEHMMTLWKSTMSDDANKELPFEPKITRAKLREFKAKHPDIEETILNRYPQPSSSRASDLVKLLTEDFGEDDDDENEDEEYQPSEDEVSDDDSEASMSILSGSMPSSPAVTCAPDSPAPATPEPETEETIALRTRSKLPLTSEALEQLEANFVAPDITADMYDTDCDDEEWNEFLRDLLKPSQQAVQEDEDAEDEDPPYNVLEDTEEVDELDLRFDRATKISKVEINDLVKELWEMPIGPLSHSDETDDEDIVNSTKIPAPPLFQEVSYAQVSDPPGPNQTPITVESLPQTSQNSMQVITATIKTTATTTASTSMPSSTITTEVPTTPLIARSTTLGSTPPLPSRISFVAAEPAATPLRTGPRTSDALTTPVRLSPSLVEPSTLLGASAKGSANSTPSA